MARYAGVDGCRAGWIVAVIDHDGSFLPLQVLPTFAEVIEATAETDLVLVDIPIGLQGATAREERACDRMARRALGARRASVFPVPVRASVHASTYAEACARHQAATGRKISRQTWNIAGKIAEVDALLRATPQLQSRIRESHPEVCFAALNGGRPMGATKKTEAGLRERLAILAAAGKNAEEALAEARGRFRRSDVATDDIADAMVTAVTACLGAVRGLSTLPPHPPVDEAGLRMEILFARPDLQAFLGKMVTVTIDRPLGSRHPSGHAILYPVNYGYIPGTMSGDGQPVDAYVLGVFEPVAAADGIVIGIARRADDVEDKLVVAPPGRRYTAEQISALVEFQERFFDSRVIARS